MPSHDLTALSAMLIAAWMAVAIPLCGGPSARDLSWNLEYTSQDQLLWRGELPPVEPRRIVPWRARAVWTNLWDATDQIVLADSGRLVSEYLPRHQVPLGTLARPPGPGIIELELTGCQGCPVSATAATWGPQSRWEDLKTKAEAAVQALGREIAVANTYAIRRPESGALHRIASVYLGEAKNLESPYREELGAWWLIWIAHACQREREWLVELRGEPALWSPLPDPPVNDLAVQDGRFFSQVAWNDRVTTFPIRLAVMEGVFAPQDAEILRALGFNAIHSVDDLRPEVRAAATRMNIAVLDEPSGDRKDVLLVSGWRPFDPADPGPIAADPWLLWHRSQEAIAHRRLAELPSFPDNPGVMFDFSDRRIRVWLNKEFIRLEIRSAGTPADPIELAPKEQSPAPPLLPRLTGKKESPAIPEALSEWLGEPGWFVQTGGPASEPAMLRSPGWAVAVWKRKEDASLEEAPSDKDLLNRIRDLAGRRSAIQMWDMN